MEAHRVFHEQKTLLPKSLHAVLDELREAVEVRRQLERQRQLLRWMHWWLMLHVPISILLLVFLAAHVLMALRVVPWQF
jgi:CHASE3 domain sensor protein